MERVMILNASPRAPKSNSKRYAETFASYCPHSEYREVRKTNHLELCQAAGEFSDILLVFPLYADSLPVTLLNFLKTLASNAPDRKPVISAIVNCGFIEPHQNDVAIDMLRLYCQSQGYRFGSALKIGSGEAILATPFRILVRIQTKRFANSIANRAFRTFEVTMPIPKRLFIKASSTYWENYGKRNGVTRDEMGTMQIE